MRTRLLLGIAVEIVEDIAHSLAARTALRAGYLPIGTCVYGGDGYYVRIADLNAPVQPLLRIYEDGTNPEGPVPVPEDAVELVALSFEDVILKAALERPGA